MGSNSNTQPSNPASEVISPQWVPFTINIFLDEQEGPGPSEAKEQPRRPPTLANGKSPLESSGVDSNPTNDYFTLIPASYRPDHKQYQQLPLWYYILLCIRGRGRATPLDLIFSRPFRRLETSAQGTLRMVQAAADKSLLASELDLSKLDYIHPWLWLAGKPIPPYPLHYQKVLSRDIFVTERMDMHLVWTKKTDMHLIPTSARLYLKPIPRFLLDPRFWIDHLQCTSEPPCVPQWLTYMLLQVDTEPRLCEPCRARRCATGFLLSYAALVSHESDYMISQHHHLLPQEMTWSSWKTFLQQLFADPDIHEKISPRFGYGELRLRRLDNICRYRYIADKLNQRSCVTSIRGYNYGYSLYSEPWAVSITVYIALVLTAMQVGLATNQLKDNNTFHATSYGFAIFSITGPLVLAAFLVAAFILYTGFSLLTLSLLNSSMSTIHLMERLEREN